MAGSDSAGNNDYVGTGGDLISAGYLYVCCIAGNGLSCAASGANAFSIGVTESLAFSCATSSAGLGSGAGCIYPSVLVSIGNVVLIVKSAPEAVVRNSYGSYGSVVLVISGTEGVSGAVNFSYEDLLFRVVGINGRSSCFVCAVYVSAV